MLSNTNTLDFDFLEIWESLEVSEIFEILETLEMKEMKELKELLQLQLVKILYSEFNNFSKLVNGNPASALTDYKDRSNFSRSKTLR